jgi:hypothetical protein
VCTRALRFAAVVKERNAEQKSRPKRCLKAQMSRAGDEGKAHGLGLWGSDRHFHQEQGWGSTILISAPCMGA